MSDPQMSVLATLGCRSIERVQRLVEANATQAGSVSDAVRLEAMRELIGLVNCFDRFVSRGRPYAVDELVDAVRDNPAGVAVAMHAGASLLLATMLGDLRWTTTDGERFGASFTVDTTVLQETIGRVLNDVDIERRGGSQSPEGGAA